MRRTSSSINRSSGLFLLMASAAINASAQTPQEREFVANAGGGWWFSVILLVVTVIGVTAYFRMRGKNLVVQPQNNHETLSFHYASNETYEMDGLDADKELEWLRKAKKTTTKPSRQNSRAATNAAAVADTTLASSRNLGEASFDTKAFQEKMRKMQYAQLPINSFSELSTAKLYEPLPLSDDPAALTAIEQADEEFEEDESVRELAVRILTAFRTRNSVEALSQIALYDLSSNLRSKAVSTLTDFDHPSVFETILLACADPTREVRAAAARGLFRLSFDRSDAWKRIIETNDEFRMSHAARAAIESGIVVKSFDRLVHEDLKVAYEAFTLVSLMIRSGETATIFNAIRTHKDERVRFALLHVLKMHRNDRTMAELNELLKIGTFSPEVTQRIYDAISNVDRVMA